MDIDKVKLAASNTILNTIAARDTKIQHAQAEMEDALWWTLNNYLDEFYNMTGEWPTTKSVKLMFEDLGIDDDWLERSMQTYYDQWEQEFLAQLQLKEEELKRAKEEYIMAQAYKKGWKG